jgi:hypothetical protein
VLVLVHGCWLCGIAAALHCYSQSFRVPGYLDGGGKPLQIQRRVSGTLLQGDGGK